jgi:hypothetical protein
MQYIWCQILLRVGIKILELIFLYGLWNEREINIVINLYKELESKQHSDKKSKIYDNLMNYCSMKETKLNKYIEQNSSIL